MIGYLRGLVITFGEFERADELIDLLVADGRPDEAVLVASHVADHGPADPQERLDRMLTEAAAVTRAVERLERRAADPEEFEDVAPALAELLYRHGLLERLLARAAADDPYACLRAADLLVERGRSGEALRILDAVAGPDGLWDRTAHARAQAIRQGPALS